MHRTTGWPESGPKVPQMHLFELQAFGGQHVRKFLHRKPTYRRLRNELQERRRESQPAQTELAFQPLKMPYQVGLALCKPGPACRELPKPASDVQELFHKADDICLLLICCSAITA